MNAQSQLQQANSDGTVESMRRVPHRVRPAGRTGAFGGPHAGRFPPRPCCAPPRALRATRARVRAMPSGKEDKAGAATRRREAFAARRRARQEAKAGGRGPGKAGATEGGTGAQDESAALEGTNAS